MWKEVVVAAMVVVAMRLEGRVCRRGLLLLVLEMGMLLIVEGGERL